MSGAKARPFHCTTVDEPVKIRLTSRRIGGFDGHTIPFIQCDQHECQYVDENTLPCPVNLGMFAEDMAEQARKKREEY